MVKDQGHHGNAVPEIKSAASSERVDIMKFNPYTSSSCEITSNLKAMCRYSSHHRGMAYCVGRPDYKPHHVWNLSNSALDMQSDQYINRPTVIMISIKNDKTKLTVDVKFCIGVNFEV